MQNKLIMKKETLKNIWAVIAATTISIILSLGTDFILEKAGVFPTGALFISWLLVLAALYRDIYTVLAGYVAASFSETNPMRQVKITGSIALLANLIGLITTWNQHLGPAWYPISLTIPAFPLAWLGGKLKVK